jgi:predicted DNA-binding antitoxin AbrB/MazE fold protein
MSYTIQAVYENGVLRPLEKLNLDEHQQVQIVIESRAATRCEDSDRSDPLAGIRVQTGIADLAEHFDDYRFGRRSK